MKKYILVLLLVVLSISLVGFGGSFTINGGEQEQRLQLYQLVEDSTFDFYGVETITGVNIWLVDMLAGEEDIGGEVLGTTWTGGTIFIKKYWTQHDFDGNITHTLMYRPQLTEVAAHELGHAVWFSGNYQMWHQWREMVELNQPDANPASWFHSYVESFAEHFKLYMYPPEYLYQHYVRNELNIIDEMKFKTFLQVWYGDNSVEDMQPLSDWFRDIEPQDDFDLYYSTDFVYEAGWMMGKTNGLFSPYGYLTKRHIALVAQRAGLPYPDWINDYSLATRADVKAWFPFLTWYEDRWDENITRGQFARLLLRTTEDKEPTIHSTLVGYCNKSDSEIQYLKTNASGAKLTCSVEELVGYYNFWGPMFGIRADMALAQAIKETGHFEYGGIVNWTDNNFCGLGGGPNETLAKFPSAELGVIAHIAHLACYAYPEDITIWCSSTYDPKHDHYIYHKLNPTGGNTTWLQLNGVWAVPGTNYAQDIARIAARF